MLSIVPPAQIGEEIVLKDLRELHQGAGVNPRTREDEIDVVAVAAQLLCEPRHLDALLRHHLLDVPADMKTGVLNFIVRMHDCQVVVSFPHFLQTTKKGAAISLSAD